MTIKYLSAETTPLYVAASGSKQLLELLWGDRLTVLDSGLRGSLRKRVGPSSWASN